MVDHCITWDVLVSKTVLASMGISTGLMDMDDIGYYGEQSRRVNSG